MGTTPGTPGSPHLQHGLSCAPACHEARQGKHAGKVSGEMQNKQVCNVTLRAESCLSSRSQRRHRKRPAGAAHLGDGRVGDADGQAGGGLRLQGGGQEVAGPAPGQVRPRAGPPQPHGAQLREAGRLHRPGGGPTRGSRPPRAPLLCPGGAIASARQLCYLEGGRPRKPET